MAHDHLTVSRTQLQWLQGSSWTVAIILLVTTLLAVLLALIAIVRRSRYASRAGRVVLSVVLCTGFFPAATIVFEKVYSGSPGFRVHVGDPGFGTTWDLLIVIGSTWIGLCIGWMTARLLAQPPTGWIRSEGRMRDIGLLLLLIAGVALLFASTTGPSFRTPDDTIDVSTWGIWALAEAVPLMLHLRGRLRAGILAPASIDGNDRLDRLARGFLARYYWLAAVALPYALWGLSRLQRESLD